MNATESRRVNECFDRYRRTGDLAALTEAFDSIAPDLLSLAHHMTRETADAEDLVQETFLIGLRKIRRWNPKRPVMPWLAGILIRVAKKQRRLAARRFRSDELAGEPAPAPDRAALDGELRNAVGTALARLPEKYRDVLEAYLIKEEAPADIAARLARAPGTVRVQIHRGLDLLRKNLPTTFALGLSALLGQRGLTAIREIVRAEAIALGPPLAATSILTGTLPAIVMNQKAIAAVGLVVAGLLGANLLMTEDANEEPAAVTPVTETAGKVRGPDVQLVAGSQQPEREIGGEPVEAAVKETPEALAPAGKSAALLIVRLIHEETPPEGGFDVEISLSGSPAAPLYEKLVGPGTYEFDVSALFKRKAAGDTRLLVVGRGENFLPSSSWAVLESEDADGTARYVAALTPKPLLRVLSGRLVASGGFTHELSWVAFFPAETGGMPEYLSLSSVFVQPDGTFELALDHVDPGRLLGVSPGYAVTHLDLDDEARGAVDLGDIELDPGASISGTAFDGGVRLGETACVRAALERVPSPWVLATRGLVYEDGQAAWREVFAGVGEDGKFTIRGLQPGIKYALHTLPGATEANTYVTQEAVGTRVRAPASGVTLDSSLMRVPLVVRSAEKPVGHPEIRTAVSAAQRSSPFHAYFNWSGPPRFGDSRGRIDLWIARDRNAEIEVSAKGYEPRTIVIAPETQEPGVDLAVELEPRSQLMTLIVNFQYEGQGSLDGTSVSFVQYDASMRVEASDAVTITGGQARFDEVHAGFRDGRLMLRYSPNVSCAELPLARIGYQPINLEQAEPGSEVSVDIEVNVGGRIELDVLGRDPNVGIPAFELVEASGNVVRPPMYVNTEDGHANIVRLDRDGPFFMGLSLPAGVYTVRQVSAAYEPDEQRVEVVAGETVQAAFALVPRS